MPQTAVPMQIMTANSKMPGYSGQEPFGLEHQVADAPMRQRAAVYGPPSLQPATGFSRDDRAQNPTSGMTYMYRTEGPDWQTYGYGHPTLVAASNRITSTTPLKAPPDNDPAAQLARKAPNSPFWQNWQAPSIQQVATFMGGYQNG